MWKHWPVQRRKTWRWRRRASRGHSASRTSACLDTLAWEEKHISHLKNSSYRCRNNASCWGDRNVGGSTCHSGSSFCSEAMRRKVVVCRGQQGNRVTRWHHPTPCACYFTTSETAGEQRRGSAVWHLASILQLLTDLKQLGLILTAGIFQLNKGSGFHDKTPLKPPRGITAAPTWQHSVSCEDSSKFLI